MPKKMIDEVTQKIKKAYKTLANKKNVIFVCTGNTCRSPMAAMIFYNYLKDKDLLGCFSVQSAGLCVTEQSFNPLAREALINLQIAPMRHEATQLDILMVTSAFSVICMEQSHKESIQRAVGELKHVKSMDQITKRGDIADPYGTDFSNYLETAKALLGACDMILEDLQADLQATKSSQAASKKAKKCKQKIDDKLTSDTSDSN